MTEEKPVLETEDKTTDGGTVSESLYKDLLAEKEDKDSTIKELTDKLEKAGYTAQKLRKENKELKEKPEEVETLDAQPFDPAQITDVVKDAVSSILNEQKQQSAEEKLQTLLGGVEDEYKREAIMQTLPLVNSQDPQKAFELAETIVDAQVQKLAATKGDANPDAPASAGSKMREETVPQIVEMAREKLLKK